MARNISDSGRDYDFDDYDEYDYAYGRSRRSGRGAQARSREAARTAMRRKRKKRAALLTTAISVIVVIALIVGVVTGVYLWVKNSWDSRNITGNFGGGGSGLPNELYTGEVSSDEDIRKANDNLNTSKDGLKEIRDTSYVTNILLVGTDTRLQGEDLTQAGADADMRTDSMMLISINTRSKKIIMCSLLRDMYVQVDKYGGQKLNAAFFYGGTDLLRKTLKDEFYIDVDYFMAVDFFSFIDIVDALGGIEMTLTRDEIYVANNSYIIELNKINNEPFGTDYIDMDDAGKPILLNGKQALAYSRNRYSYNPTDGTNDDFGRTSRQRAVLSTIVEKVKTKSILELSALYGKILPYITTNIPSDKLMDLVLNNFFDYSNFEFIQTCLPQEDTYTDVSIPVIGDCLSVDFKENNNYLSDLIYGD